MTHDDWQALYKELAAPFNVSSILWRAGALSRDKKRAQALPYAEPRVYEDRLNELAPGAWGVTFKPWGENRIICELTIYDVTRSSTGEENDGFAPGTAAEAQAFKRACVKFGLGRYLYDIPISWVSYDAERRTLSETPALAAKFLPAAKAPAKKPMPELSNEPPLAPERARKMILELVRLKIQEPNQLAYAESVLGKKVSSLESLSETEALEVYTRAKHRAGASA